MLRIFFAKDMYGAGPEFESVTDLFLGGVQPIRSTPEPVPLQSSGLQSSGGWYSPKTEKVLGPSFSHIGKMSLQLYYII